MEETPWAIKWSAALSMSHPEIDAEHRHFIDLINKLNSAIVYRKGKLEVEQILKQVLEDAIAHFTHEEQLFVMKKYPLRQEHSQIHAELVDRFRQAFMVIHASSFDREWIELGLSLKNQFLDHILNEDTKYIEYLRTE